MEPAVRAAQMETVDPDAKEYKRELSFRDLLMVSITGVIGSGWLFGSYNAAKIAGAGSIVAWLLGAAAILISTLPNAELVGMFPRAGGAMRYPLYSHGSFAAFIVAWASWIPGAAGAATESAAVIQYASSYLPGLYSGDRMSGIGIALAALLVILFSYVNLLGIRWFARINTPLTMIKLIVPSATIVVLLVTSFHPENFGSVAAGGFFPSGIRGVFVALATSGIIYSYLGSTGPVQLAAEARNPKRHIPMAILAVVGLSMIVYVLLQVVFIGALPEGMLRNGWGSLHFNAPFVELLASINLVWCSYILYADAVLSPSGTALTATATVARILYAMGLQGWAPKLVAAVDKQRGVPVAAILINTVVGLVFLLPFPSWQALIGVVVICALFTNLVFPATVSVLRRTVPNQERPFKVPWLRVTAPLSSAVSCLIMYWIGWPAIGQVMLFFALGIGLYFVGMAKRKLPWQHVKAGVWLVVAMAFLPLVSYLGTFGGQGVIRAPWDSIIVGAGGVLLWLFGDRSGLSFPAAVRGQIQKDITSYEVEAAELVDYDLNF
ncbi:MAG: APC family permease [Alicyclobacillus macrosporangiidus]|uniref:APC family permease n=1 Tax=Alicyclobacillus macrosporangiidus TaxID=392015 RepID=UPI0026EC2AA0|nr:APC family permease [Alicyclobacillus macrosporangiidus]MCL6600738.1 APC family permease [Alicyclobacillus macrosporangiidus]